MNIKQKTKILEIIENNCTIRYQYKGGPGEHCIIGGLAEAIGIMDKTLELSDGYSFDTELKPYLKKISMEFGLRFDDLHELQRINDTNEDIQKRREKLKKYIKSKEVL